MLTAERLRAALDYDAVSGVFHWETPTNQRIVKGVVAGHKGPKGYWFIRIDGRRYCAHRLAWLHFYGQWPAEQIDHINRNKLDNGIDNLRDVSDRVNKLNVDRSNVLRDWRGRFAA